MNFSIDDTSSEVIKEYVLTELKRISLQDEVETLIKPQISKIAENKNEENEINELIRNIIYAHGGKPQVIITDPKKSKPVYDTFIESTLSEILNMYSKTRRSVINSNSLLITINAFKNKPPIFSKLPPEDAIKYIEDYFWDSVETSYLRLASYWDRIGQLLNFSYFNLRKYEKETFSEVIEKINSNYTFVIKELEINPSYKNIWEYSKLENKEGLKWLLQRRNLLIHSVGLCATEYEHIDNDKYCILYNHLDMKIKNKLKKGELENEINQINFHFNKLCEVFKDCLSLSMYATENCIKRK